MKPRLSMRTALWIVVLVAIFAGWMADRYRLNYKINSLNRAKVRRAVDALTIERAKFNAEKAELKARHWEAKFRNLEAQRKKDKTP